MVVVPLRAVVNVYLPDRALPESVGTGEGSRTFRWDAPEPEGEQGPG